MTKTNDTPIFITLQTAAERLNISAVTMRRILISEHIPAYKIGKQIRIPASDFEAYVERSKLGGD